MRASRTSSPTLNTTIDGYNGPFKYNTRNAIYQIAAASRKRMRDDYQPLIRIYTGGAMATGQTHVGLFDIAMEETGLLEKG